MRYILGNVFRPAFSSIEGDDADRIAVLTGEEILSDLLDRWPHSLFRAKPGQPFQNHRQPNRPSDHFRPRQERWKASS